MPIPRPPLEYSDGKRKLADGLMVDLLTHSGLFTFEIISSTLASTAQVVLDLILIFH